MFICLVVLPMSSLREKPVFSIIASLTSSMMPRSMVVMSTGSGLDMNVLENFSSEWRRCSSSTLRLVMSMPMQRISARAPSASNTARLFQDIQTRSPPFFMFSFSLVE